MGPPNRRTLLLEAASRLLVRYGPQKTTIGDIAREAGIGVGSVYLEFENKDAILKAIATDRYSLVLRAIEHAWGMDGSPADRLRRAIEARFDSFVSAARAGHHAAELLHCGHCSAVLASFEEFKRRELELFERIIQEGCDTGAFRRGEPRALARALLLAYSAFSPPGVLGREADGLRSEIASVHDLVFCGLLAR